MALNLPEPLRSRLIELVACELTKATVIGNFAISPWIFRDKAINRTPPDKGQLAEDLRRYIGEEPLTTFFSGELARNFVGGAWRNDPEETPLSDHEGYGDLRVIATSLVDSFATLPWTYKLSVELPSFGDTVNTWLGSIELSPRHRITTGNILRQEFPVTEKPKGLAMYMTGKEPAPAWRDDAAYLQIEMQGYFENRHTEPFLAARDDAVTFFGLAVALGLYDDAYSLMRRSAEPSHFYVHRRSGEEWIESTAIDVDDRYVAGIKKIGVAREFRDKPVEIRSLLDRIGSVFRSDAGRTTGMSARWMFESLCGQDALLQYVQAAVACEILLGDENQDPDVGLTTLMANRCAFAIGITPNDRAQLISLFRDIYKVRSKIVHRGKNRLNAGELALFSSLKTILRALIDNEQKMLEREEAFKKAGVITLWR